MTVADVVVVGAGPGGLAAAGTLRASGFDPMVIDRAESIGSAWRTRYDSFRLHTVRWLSGLPGMPIPKTAGQWVARDDFVHYLEIYADRFRIAPSLNTELRGIRGLAGHWKLTTSQGDLHAQRIVLATGANTDPYVPRWPGYETYTGELVHSHEYRNPAKYAGMKVLVVGSGNSASEIAADLAAAGNVEVELAVRTAPTILRRAVYGIPTQLVGIATRPLPARAVDPLAATMRRISIPDLKQFGLPAPKAPFSQIKRTGTLPILDHGFVSAVCAGAITIRPGVSELTVDAVTHSDGSRSRPDAIIAGTGYRPGLSDILAELGDMDLTTAPARPSIGPTGGNRAGLYGVGVDVVLSGMLREIGRDAQRLVRAIGPK